MVTTWSGNDSSRGESEDEEIENLCFMARVSSGEPKR